MPLVSARIRRISSNNQFAYIVEVDGVATNAAINVATLNAAIDAIKPIVAAQPGTVDRVILNVTVV